MFSRLSRTKRERLRKIVTYILYQKKTTRKQLEKHFSLSSASIFNYVKILLESSVIRETNEITKSGRRYSSFLEINTELGIAIVLLIDHFHIHGAISDPLGNILYQELYPFPQNISDEKMLDFLIQSITAILPKASPFKKKLLGLAIGVRGYTDPSAGIVKSFSGRHQGNDINLKKILFIWMDKGISMGIVTNNEVYFGENSASGELGHIKIENQGNLCYCGNTGCLETLISEKKILEECRSGIKNGVNSSILANCNGEIDSLRIEHVIKSANEGDAFSRTIFVKISDIFGMHLANMINIFNPGIIILKGSIINSNNFLFDNIKRSIMNKAYYPNSESLKIIYSKDNEDIRLKGLNSLIILNLFN
ncbi:N-acetylglucosamine repressor [subsurface metagenome]